MATIDDDDRRAAQYELEACAKRIHETAGQLRELANNPKAWDEPPTRERIGQSVADLRNLLTPIVYWLDFYREHTP